MIWMVEKRIYGRHWRAWFLIEDFRKRAEALDNFKITYPNGKFRLAKYKRMSYEK